MVGRDARRAGGSMYVPGVGVSTLDRNPAAIGSSAASGGGREFDYCVPTRAFSVPIESERLWSFVLKRFLHANRCPLRSKTL